MSRLRPEMDLPGKIIALADGNIGSADALMQLCGVSEKYLAIFDELDITGSDIYLVYNDVCGRHVGQFATLVIATYGRVNGFDREKLLYAANHRGAGIDLASLEQHDEEIAALMKRHLS